MNSMFEQLLALASPLFAAVASGKKRTPKKSTTKRVAKPKPVARAKKPVAHKAVASKKVAAKATPKTAARKPATPSKKSARPVAPAKPEGRKGTIPAKPEPHKGTLPVKPEPKVVTPPPPAPKPVRPAGRPILLSPENGKYADNINPKFRWLSVGSATRYEVIWSQDPNLINGYSVVSIATEATVPLEKPLAIGVTYYWHVRGGNEAGWGPWSMPASFSVLEEEANI